MNNPHTDLQDCSVKTLSCKSMKSSISLASDPALSIITKKTNWTSLYLLAAICAFSGIQFSLFFVSLWPYFRTIDRTADTKFFGFINSAYSLGQGLSSPFYGLWMNKSKSVRSPLIFGLTLMIISNLLFCVIETFPMNQRRWVLFIVRFCIGLGNGTVGILRAYAATASTTADRSKAISLFQASFAFGMTIGPGLQVIFTPIGYPGYNIGPISINMYTTSAIFAALIRLISLILLYTVFEESYAGLTSDLREKNPLIVLPKFAKIPVGVCLITQFLFMLVFTNLETIGSVYATTIWAWSNYQNVLYYGSMQLVSGAVQFIGYMLILGPIGQYVGNGNERSFAIIGLAFALIFHLVTYPYSFYSPLPYIYEGNSTQGNETSAAGCDMSVYKWCNEAHEVPVLLYVISFLILFSISLVFVNVSVPTIFSKILGSRRQGTMQGINLMAGCVGRTVGPIFISHLFQNFGPSVAWGMEIVVLVPTILLWIIFYRRIVPLEIEQLSTGEFFNHNGEAKCRF